MQKSWNVSTDDQFMFFLRDRLMCHVVWPICRRLPAPVWAMLSRVIAVPTGLLTLGCRRQLVRDISRTVDRDTWIDLIQIAIERAYYRLRYLDFYFYECVPHLKVLWPDDQPETERCIYVLANTCGSETASAFADRYPSVVVRMPFGSEGKTSYATARKGFRWWGHLAEVREKACRGRMIATTGSALQYRALLHDPRNIIIYQDLWHPQDGHATLKFLGHDVPMKLGAIKLSHMCGDLPLRFISIKPEGGAWVLRVSPRLPSENAGPRIVKYLEDEVRNRPGAWEQWEIFLPRFAGSKAVTRNEAGIVPLPAIKAY